MPPKPKPTISAPSPIPEEARSKGTQGRVRFNEPQDWSSEPSPPPALNNLDQGVDREGKEDEQIGAIDGDEEGHAALQKGGDGLGKRKIKKPSTYPGYVPNNQKYQSTPNRKELPKGRKGAAKRETSSAKRAAKGRVPDNPTQEDDNELADHVNGMLNSTIQWLQDGAAIAGQLEEHREALVNVLKRGGSDERDRGPKRMRGGNS